MVDTDRLCLGCMNDNGGEKVCPICGYDSSEDNNIKYLAVGTWLNANRYLVGKAVKAGGDGVTYIGWDNDLNAVVNIREYFPEGIARRSADRLTVTPAENQGITFTKEMEEFYGLYRKLSALPDSSSVLKVIDVFEYNGTVYAVMNTVSGTSLKSFLVRNGGTLSFEQVKMLFSPFFSTVSELHEAGIYHRAISPDNIIVGRDGKLHLSGFSVKNARVAHSRLPAQLHPGYAAPEQYLENEVCGAESDIYALGAVMFRCLVGTNPPDAKERLSADKLSIPSKLTETVPKAALATIAGALKMDKYERISSAERFKKMLDAVIPITLPEEKSEAVVPEVKKKNKADKKNALMAFGITAGVIAIIIGVILLIAFSDDIFGNESEYVDGDSISSNISSDDSSSVKSEPSKPTETLYTVPSYRGKSYNEVKNSDSLSGKFTVVIMGSEFSDSVQRGLICRQTVDAGKDVAKNTEIGVYLSLGPKTLKMPTLEGKTKDQAYIKLLEMGFYPSNIKFVEKHDDTVIPGGVVSVSHSAGKSVTITDVITVYVNPENVVPTTPPASSSETETTE